MSQGVNSPIILLFEDRPKQGMVFQLNLSIYLDARVIISASLKELKKHLASPEGVHLIITRAQLKGAPVTGKIADFLTKNGIATPLICLGFEKEREGVVVTGSDTEVKPMLQSAAKILGITARQMVSKERPAAYQIPAELLKLLFSFPCDVYLRRARGLEPVFSSGSAVPRARVAKLQQEGAALYVDSVQRLRLVNAVTEQSLRAAEELEGEGVSEEKKMSILSASVDMVAAQFQNAGMDEETVKLANASIKAVEKIAESATSVGNLVKQLLDAQGGYRYAHSQLITFLGFHVIKMMGWWGDDQRAVLSQAAFYHDISLNTDELVKIQSQRQLDAAGLSGSDPALAELVLTHAQLAARELQTSPDVSPEVVQVVIQHHGVATGRGFSRDISRFDNLTKTFILSEAWADYLIELAETNAPPINEAKIEDLKAQYPDALCAQIIETFRYLDPKEFRGDFLESRELEFAQSLISGGEASSVVVLPEAAARESSVPGEAGDTAETAEALAARQLREAGLEEEALLKARRMLARLRKKRGALTPAEEKEILLAAAVPASEHQRLIAAGELSAEEETRLQAAEKESELERVVKGGAAPSEEEIRVSGRSESAEEKEARIRADATLQARATLARLRKARPGMAPEEEARLLEAAGVPAAELERVVKAGPLSEEEELHFAAGVSAREEEIRVSGESAGEKEARIRADATLQARATLARLRKARPGMAPEEEARLLEAAGVPAAELERVIKAGPLSEEEELRFAAEKSVKEERRIAGVKAAEAAKKKISGVTDVRSDEKIVIKAGAPQSYVDNSLTRIKADPQEKERELKMKALAGSTDLMRACVGGQLEALAAALGANTAVELRKTDAEGRTAIHYAAMGGSPGVLKLLVEKGAQLNSVDSKRRSPLFFAALYNKNDAFDFLLAQGAKANQQAMGGMTIAMVAAFAGNLHILKSAVEKGVKLDTKDHGGKTALDLARQANKAEAVSFIEGKLAEASAKGAKKAA